MTERNVSAVRAVQHMAHAQCPRFSRVQRTFNFPLCSFLHLTFPSSIYGQPKATRHRGSDCDSDADSDSSSSSGLLLTSADNEEEEDSL